MLIIDKALVIAKPGAQSLSASFPRYVIRIGATSDDETPDAVTVGAQLALHLIGGVEPSRDAVWGVRWSGQPDAKVGSNVIQAILQRFELAQVVDSRI